MMWTIWYMIFGCSKGEAIESGDDDVISVSAVDIPADQFEQYGLQSELFEVALKAFKKAQSTGVTSKMVYTIVDLRMHSKEKRLWTVNMQTGELLFHEVTTHGRLSDINHDGFLDTVSNVPQSKQTSVGLYKTAEVYTGSHGLSLRLDGLEKGFNDNARRRKIVIHGADYAGEEFIQKHGRLGRSLGCPSVSNDVSDELISVIKEGSLLFMYTPNEDWLKGSTFLQ